MGGRLTSLLFVVFGVGAALTLAPAAQAKNHYLRFKITSVSGQQTVNWHDSVGYGDCGNITRSGSQTIAFKSTRPAKLKLLRLRLGKHHVTYNGVNFIRANWTFTRNYQESPPPACALEPALASQAPDCGTQGPFAVPIDIGWRDGKVNLRGVLDPMHEKHPVYKTCRYDGFHNEDLVLSFGRLSRKRLTSRSHRAIRVKVAEKVNAPTPEAEGSSTTSLKATVTLKRIF